MPTARPLRVILPRPPHRPGAAALDDLALITAEAAGELGLAVTRAREGVDPDALNILIGGHLLEGEGLEAIPDDVVLYNTVPVPVGGLAGTFPDYARCLARNPVWDVSQASLDALVEASARPREGTQHVPPGWVPGLGRVPVARSQDIGILFIGAMTRERWRLLGALESQGQGVRHVAEVSGQKRDALVARARLILELAPLPDQPAEPTRLLYLLANRKAVLAEATPELEADPVLRAGVRLAPFDDLERACQRLGNDIDGRHALEQRGLDAARRRDGASVLKRALSRLAPALRERPDSAAGGPVAVTAAAPRPAAAPVSALMPTLLNMNGGRDPLDEALNLDLPGARRPLGVAAPDIVADPCDSDLPGQRFDTDRFGPVTLAPGAFGRILAPWVPARVADMTAFMETCLALLAEDGALELLVPYDLSHGAWADPGNRRAFNEHAFTAFTDGHAAIGWRQARFDLDSLEFAFSALGEGMEAEGATVEAILATPRAVDAMRVVLRKRTLAPPT
jgi:hypothetical protein